MEGITVLAQNEVTQFNGLAFFIGSIAAATIACIVFCCIDYSELSALAIPIGLAIGFFANLLFPLPPVTQYQVTINEEVSMAEFYEKYEIIEQDGQIFTIRERNDEDVAG